jgi:hypothetical protein
LNIRNYDINLKSEVFEFTVSKLIEENVIEEIIETGTFNGLGSTTVFAETGKKIISIESNFENFKEAKKNLKKYTNVELYHGSSLNIKDMEEFIDNDDIYESEEIKNGSLLVDVFTDSISTIKNFYKKEITATCTCNKGMEDILFKLINNDKKQLVFLDSAGGVGYLEFKKFMSLDNTLLKNKVLLLDDISHVKHYRSVLFLKQKDYNVVISDDERFAFCIFGSTISAKGIS